MIVSFLRGYSKLGKHLNTKIWLKNVEKVSGKEFKTKSINKVYQAKIKAFFSPPFRTIVNKFNESLGILLGEWNMLH